MLINNYKINMAGDNDKLNALEEKVEQSVNRKMGDPNLPTYDGQVKWFSNKIGYGFVKVVRGDRTGEDVFVHHSNVCPNNSEYRSLRVGEYVSFQITKVEDGNTQHQYQATNVTGINGGSLLCDVIQKAPQNTSWQRNKSKGRQATSDESS